MGGGRSSPSLCRGRGPAIHLPWALRTIGGDLVIDNSAFETPETTRDAFGGGTRDAYNALPVPFAVNFQVIQVEVLPEPSSRRLCGATGLAGFLEDSAGRRWILVSLINNPRLQAWRGKATEDAILRWAFAQAGRATSGQKALAAH